jgi:UDP-GlcNAc:undecaprenyl-phosphate GlcNAc-1-phosphate transferase
MSLRLLDLVPVTLSLGLTLLLTPVVRALARCAGVVARVRSDRWHQQPTALLGGVAMFPTIVCILLACDAPIPHGHWILAGSAVAFTTGLIDDLRRIRPYLKLIGQLLAAALVLLDGLTFPWTGLAGLDVVITLFWLVGITNALNLLDNMDGLAAGIAALAAGFLAAAFHMDGQRNESLWVAIFAAALLGFLLYNSNPASIFMGDCGSLFLGFYLASMALVGKPPGGSSRALLAPAVPILILSVPIFDTTLVAVCRKRAGRAVSQGGRDHTSHRLVALGLSERQAVWLLYGLAALTGLLALGIRTLAPAISLTVTAALAGLMIWFGVYLARVKVYDV